MTSEAKDSKRILDNKKDPGNLSLNKSYYIKFVDKHVIIKRIFSTSSRNLCLATLLGLNA